MEQRIRVFLDGHFADFSESARGAFIQRLEEITGSPFGEFKEVIFADSCVTFTGKLPREAVLRLYEAYQQRNRETDDPAHAALLQFFEQLKVNGVQFDDYDHR